ncbi:IclR family transcriptional regulator domain-containing protein [Gluconobacter thailandicus]|nr:IclR family transcriptional regulator C-terminal domain-containing protein [Gluconobacter thailandicus]
MSNPSLETSDKPKVLVGSLAYGLNIIMAFDRANPRMTLSQVSEKTGMDRAGARRYLLTLAHLGFVIQDGRLFQLSPKVMELGYAYLSSVPLSDKAHYYLDRIRDQTGFPVALGIRDGLDIVHIASANTDEFSSPALTIGRRFPIAYASAGRCILALMEKAERDTLFKKIRLEPMSEMSISTMDGLRKQLQIIRKQGYALVDQEMQLGIRSLAVPVFNTKGKVVASFNTFTFSSIVPTEKLISDALPAMQAAAEEIQTALI